jgi:hypothetical protein
VRSDRQLALALQLAQALQLRQAYNPLRARFDICTVTSELRVPRFRTGDKACEPWPNHGEFVRHVAGVSGQLASADAITLRERAATVWSAA